MKTAYSGGERVYVEALQGHVVLVDEVDHGSGTWAVVEDNPRARLHKVHVSAMEPAKSDLFRHPGETTRGDA